LNPLDVRRDHADLGLIGEVGGEVGELEIDLVAGRRPVADPDAELLALEHGTALVPALGDERDRRAREVVAEVLERVQVRVRPQQAGVGAPHEVVEAGFERLALAADLREPGGEDHRERRLPLHDLLERVDRLAREDDGEVDVARDVEHRAVAARADDGVVLGVHGIEGGTVAIGPPLELVRHRRVGLARRLGSADDRHRPRMEEAIEVDGS
jgi:hypothetical protein